MCVYFFFLLLLFTLSVSALYFCIKCKFDMWTSTYSKRTAKVTSEETRKRSQMSLQEFANKSLILIFQKMTTHLWRIIVTCLQFFERKFVNSRGIRKKHSPLWNWKKKKKNEANECVICQIIKWYIAIIQKGMSNIGKFTRSKRRNMQERNNKLI